MINSHQPLEGPVAWYEAHLKSEEGWDVHGGLFPGMPFIAKGFNPDIGWGVNFNDGGGGQVGANLRVSSPPLPDKHILNHRRDWKNCTHENTDVCLAAIGLNLLTIGA